MHACSRVRRRTASHRWVLAGSHHSLHPCSCCRLEWLDAAVTGAAGGLAGLGLAGGRLPFDAQLDRCAIRDAKGVERQLIFQLLSGARILLKRGLFIAAYVLSELQRSLPPVTRSFIEVSSRSAAKHSSSTSALARIYPGLSSTAVPWPGLARPAMEVGTVIQWCLWSSLESLSVSDHSATLMKPEAQTQQSRFGRLCVRMFFEGFAQTEEEGGTRIY